MESTAASSFILHPNASVPSTDAAERFASMSVTRNPGATIVEERRARAVRVPASLNVDDIAGARPRSLAPRAGGGFFGTQDVEGAQPRALHRGISYTPEAVEGSAPRATKFRTNRVTDPVAPGSYGLPPAPQPLGVALPYKRDLVLRNDDIAGSQPSAHLPWRTREHHTDVSDIAGTTSRPRTLPYQHQHVDANLDVRDINAFRVFRSQRRSDPQRPAFAVHGRVVADEDAGMFVAPARAAGQHPEFSLTTADIEGAQAYAAKEPMVGGIKPADRRDYRVTNFTADIAGTSPGSKKKGLTTLRGTNPLERDYVLLDGRTLDVSELAMGKSWYNAASTILAAQAGAASATMLTGRSALNAGTAPYMDYARRVLDPRDAELARLRGENSVLQRERDIAGMSRALAESASATRSGGEHIASGAAASAVSAAHNAAQAAARAAEAAAGRGAAAALVPDFSTLPRGAQSHPLVPNLAGSREAAAPRGGSAAATAAAAAAAAAAAPSGGGRSSGSTVSFSAHLDEPGAAAAGSSSSSSSSSSGGDGGESGEGGSGDAYHGADLDHSIAAAASSALGSSSSSSSSRDPFLGDPGASGRGRGWHRTKGVAGLRAGAGATAYAATLSGAPHTSTARRENNNGAPLVLDPILTLRASAAPPTVRNILGVLPATRPQQDLASTATLREAAQGKFDRTLDSAAAAPRGAPPSAALPAAAAATRAAAAAAAGERSARNFELARAREAGRALAQEIAEVRNLPTFKAPKPGKA